jgi:hypothetical protein
MTATAQPAPQPRLVERAEGPDLGVGLVVRVDERSSLYVFVQWPGCPLARREHIDMIVRHVPQPVRRRR